MNISAVIVTYHPEPARLARLADTLRQGGAQVIVADNTPGGAPPPPSGCIALPMHGNVGIAKAQNAAIRRALDDGADVILFFDQDSTIEAGFVDRLLARLDPAVPGVMGPVFHDERQGFECPSYVLSPAGYPNKVLSGGRTTPYEVDVRISSGSAITARTFAVAGLLDESLFLDYVDVEWCLRARARGVPIRIDPAVTMRHAIGHSAVQVGPLKVFIDGPVRTYYRMRNALLLLRKPEVPLLFALKEITSELVHHFIQLFIADQKPARLRAYLAGIWHGLTGRAGPAPAGRRQP